MDATEHFYQEDPRQGPADAITTLDRAHYFFLGNGTIEAAVQICRGEEGTPIGLLLMDPSVFGRKQDSLTFHPQRGLADTLLQISCGEETLQMNKETMTSRWDLDSRLPIVRIDWTAGTIKVEEEFFCPDLHRARLRRRVRIIHSGPEPLRIAIATGVRSKSLTSILDLSPGGSQETGFDYEIISGTVHLDTAPTLQPESEALEMWRNTTRLSTDVPLLNHLFHAAAAQIGATMAKDGCLDASIWQYNLEWVRDHSFISIGLLLSGQHQRARVLLQRLLTRSVSADGDTIDSGRHRPKDEIELDQNGELLTALSMYTNWTGDTTLLLEHWPIIERVAEFPFRADFLHPESGLLHNRREYWERSAMHGIEDGFELSYQMWVSLGVRLAAEMAEQLGKSDQAERWRLRAQQLKNSWLAHPTYRLVENGRLIKRRGLDGGVQHELSIGSPETLPPGVPLAQAIPHPLNPDSSAALTIAWEEIDSQDSLARKTLLDLEQLWNQNWSNGGYGRYHVNSEPDSPGPWPFASLFIARAHCQAGNSQAVWRTLRWLENIPGAESGCFFEFYGTRPIPPCPQIGMTPWTHAEMLLLLIHQIIGVRPFAKTVQICPRLLEGIKQIECELYMGKSRLTIRIERGDDSKPFAHVEGTSYREISGGIEIPRPVHDVRVTLTIRSDK